MLISELSKRTGVSIHTLRFYENYGLFKGVSDKNVKTNNYKHYGDSLIEKIALIKGAKEVGFTLAEIKELLDSWYSQRLTVEEKVAVVNRKIDEIEDKIVQLNEVKRLLAESRVAIEKGDC